MLLYQIHYKGWRFYCDPISLRHAYLVSKESLFAANDFLLGELHIERQPFIHALI